MDVRVGDIWIYDNRGEYSYWLVYNQVQEEDYCVYYLSKVGGNLNTIYHGSEFLKAADYWTLALRVK